MKCYKGLRDLANLKKIVAAYIIDCPTSNLEGYMES